ncbi:MAG: HEAT repeat domain-containing protein, partial [Rhodospirillales bacterium]|nr:HEAT repeat domain-containing protein [Rhodospirillales bacterium]
SQVVKSSARKDGDVCGALCDVLLGGIDIHRVLAAQALGHIGGEEAVDALIKALLDEDEDVRTDAATALVRLVDAKADKQLLENLIGDPCPEVKLAAMTALAATRNSEVVPWLLRILASRDEDIVWDDDEFYATGWDDWLDMQLKAIEGLANLGVEEAVPGIVTAINDDEAQDITDTAMKALARIGPAGMTALAAYMEIDNARLRRHAASVIARCDGAEAVNAVRLAICDPSVDVRLAVTRGLAGRNPEDERLEALLLDDDPQVRLEAVRCCGEHHANRLDLLLDDKNEDVRLAVLDLLANHPELTDIPALGVRLRELVRSPSVSIAAAAVVALAVVEPKNAAAELTDLMSGENISTEIQRGVIRGFKTVGGDQSVQGLVDILAGDDRQVRLEAMSAIADLAGQTDWPNVPGDTLLAAVSGALVPAPEIKVEEEKDEAADDQEETVDETQVAEEAVVAEPEDDVFPTSTLESILGGFKSQAEAPPPEDVELTAEDMEFLNLTGGAEKKGRRTVPVVPDVVLHEDVRLFAARLLGNFPYPDVTLALLDSLRNGDKELQQTAVDSLAHIAVTQIDLPVETLEVLQAVAKSESRDMRRQAVRALGCSKDASVVMILINTLDDEDSFVRSEAIRSLGRLGEAGAGVGRLLADPDAFVRLTAAQALADTAAPGVVETLVEFSYAFEGYHGREAARMLAAIDGPAANTLFIKTLHDEERKRYWKVAIEALEELNRSQISV